MYVAPGDTYGARLDAAKIRLRTILDRYKDAKNVVCGDLNIKRDKIMKEFLDYFNDKKLLIHVDTNANALTRCRKVSGGVQYSYLYYIFTYGINCYGLKECKPIAKSDHITLKLNISDSELGDIIEKRDLNFDFNGPKNDAVDTYKKLIDIFSRSSKACKLIALVAEMRKKYGPRCKKVKKCYTFKEKVKCLLKSRTNWKQFGSDIRKLSNEEYNNFLLEIADLYLKRNLKEYFMKMRFYSQISKSVSVLSDLEE